jgi:[ribosomal protein S18]-alanine N-acetyltransferase
MSADPVSVIIRPMSDAHVECALALAKTSPGTPLWSESSYLAAIDPSALPARIAHAAEDLGPPTFGQLPDLAGFAIARLLPPEAELETIVVAPAFRRRGVARALLASLTRELQLRHVTEVTLEVRVSNLPAISLYHDIGFRESARRSRYYVDPVEDAVLMSLRLP